ncbi:MAG: hypothetical protein K2Q10_11530, partial [Rhodospirillales bacterium]|nr:hypothetical protein [Rhodospirillales bacterium]
MAAMTAALAAVSERPVRVLVSMNAVLAFARDLAPEQRWRGGAFSDLLRRRGGPDPLDLFAQGKALGGLTLHVCPLALDLKGWTLADLAEDLFDGAMGLTKISLMTRVALKHTGRDLRL